MNWILLILAFLGLLFIVAVLVISSMKSSSKNVLPIITKLFLNHLQVNSQIGNFAKSTDKLLGEIFSVQGSAGSQVC
eukprot:gene5719-biopygen13307